MATSEETADVEDLEDEIETFLYDIDYRRGEPIQKVVWKAVVRRAVEKLKNRELKRKGFRNALAEERYIIKSEGKENPSEDEIIDIISEAANRTEWWQKVKEAEEKILDILADLDEEAKDIVADYVFDVC